MTKMRIEMLSYIKEKIKWWLCKEELLELERRRMLHEQYMRWLAEFKDICIVLENMNMDAEGYGLDASHPPGNLGPWTVEGLREILRQRRKAEKTQRAALGDGNLRIEHDLDQLRSQYEQKQDLLRIRSFFIGK